MQNYTKENAEMSEHYARLRYSPEINPGKVLIESKDFVPFIKIYGMTHPLDYLIALSITEDRKISVMEVPKLTILTHLTYVAPSDRVGFLNVNNYTIKVSPEYPYNFSESFYFFGRGNTACFKCIFYKSHFDTDSVGCSIDVGVLSGHMA